MLNFTEIEVEMRKYWKKIELLSLLQERNKQGEPYYMLDGPPYANNIPHIGHIRNTVYKDMIIRMAFMQGKDVLFQPGFDTHGLPIENMVEKKLGLTSKKDIEKMGVAKFCQECKKLAAVNKDAWMKVYELLGSWYSWKEPYLTYHNSYLQSAWWGFKQMWDKGMVYEGKKPVYWCPHCETSLAGYEVTDSYAMVTDPQIYVKCKIKDKDEFLVIYTTTPWTLLSNVAIAVHPDHPYVKVSTDQGTLILAKPRVKILDEFEIKYKIIEEFKGRELDGLKYEPLLNIPAQQELAKNDKAHTVYMSIPLLKGRVPSKVAMKKAVESGDEFGDFVTMDDGTGLVHTAPGHGKTDYEFGNHYNLPAVSPLDDQCKYTEEAGEFKGRFCKDCDTDIIAKLDGLGKILFVGKLQHKYPLCWRCKSKLIFRLSHQWFIDAYAVKEKILKAKTKWYPKYAQDKFHNWVENAEDWNISRQRYWGIPLPIWKCDCGSTKCIGSIKELQENAVEEVKDDFDLHTASVIHLKCDCGKQMTRVQDIGDVWFDAGSAPFASLGYPFQNKELFEKYAPPVRINESQDQVRGWFYYLMFVNTAATDKPGFLEASMPGWVVDARGDKMSKSVGNVVWAKEGLEEMGADLVRYYYCWGVAPYDLQKFNVDIGKKECGKILNILANIIKLILKEEYTPGIPELTHVEDQWIMSRYNSVIKSVLHNLDTFEYHNAGRDIGSFIADDLSRWYVQVCRDRLDKGDKTPLQLINAMILTVLTVLAPITPHLSEKLYQEMKTRNKLLKSVHLESWPTPDDSYSKPGLEVMMKYAQHIVAGILQARDKAKRGVRWPVKEAKILIKDDLHKENITLAIDKLGSLIKAQTNVKTITLSDEELGEVLIKPDYAKIKDDFPGKVGKIVSFIRAADPKKVIDDLAKQEFVEAELDKETVKLVTEHLIITRATPEDSAEGNFAEGKIYLDTTLDDDLEAEGYAREFTRRVQDLRKKAGMQKKQRISLTIDCDDSLKAMLDAHLKHIQAKVGAETVEFSKKQAKHSSKEKIKDKEFTIALELRNS